MSVGDREGELALNMDELLNTPASSIVAAQRQLRAPLHATTGGQRGKKQEQELATPEKETPLIEEGVVGIVTFVTPPP
jgi:hypothetical protein